MKYSKKELPGITDRALVPPNMDYWYFEYAQDHPFDYEREVFSPVNAWWLADASFLVYTHPGFARLSLHIAGLKGFRFFKKYSTECFVANNRDFVIVCFRGTEIKSFKAIPDIFTDINFQFADSITSGRVHKGFQTGLEYVWERKDGLHQYLLELYNKNPKLKFWFTGHSLGSALATLAADRFEHTWGLYTYGAPKVGDIVFAENYKVRAWRVLNNNDAIPLLPPNFFASSKKEMYTHVGMPVFIDRKGKVSFEIPGEEDLLGRLKVKSSTIKDSISDVKESLKKRVGLSPSGVTRDVDEHLPKGVKKISSFISYVKSGSSDELKDKITEVKKSVSDFLPIDISDHAPVYYSIHLWNWYIDNLYSSKT